MKHLGRLTESLGNLGAPQEPVLRSLSSYLELLMEWTDSVDLVSPGSAEELIQRHVRDAFVCWKLLDERGLFSAGSCLDVGSGAGLPGLVFAMLAPDRDFYLCEPRQKRVVFLQEVRRRLSLKNVTVLGKRLEELTAEDCPDVRLATFRALQPEPALVDAIRRLARQATIAFITGAQGSIGTGNVEEIPYSFPEDSTGRKIILVKPAI